MCSEHALCSRAVQGKPTPEVCMGLQVEATSFRIVDFVDFSILRLSRGAVMASIGLWI